jgi:hydroxypyruvate isomerase
MAGPKASMTWWSFADRGVSADDLIRAVASIGYDGIELADEALWPAIADAGLSIVSHRGHGTIESGLNRAENHDRIEAEIYSNLNLARSWDIPLLICFSGSREGLSDDAGIENTAQGLSRVARAAEEAGVTLVLELLNSKVDHPDYQCDRTPWGLEVIERVGSPRVRLLYDIYHMQVMEGDLMRTVQAHHGTIAHYHVAGNPGRHEPDRSQEISFPAIYEAIAATGYEGYIGMEYIPRGEPVASLRAALHDFRAATT